MQGQCSETTSAAPISESDVLGIFASASPENGAAVLRMVAESDPVAFSRIVLLVGLLEDTADRLAVPFAEICARFDRMPIRTTIPLLDHVDGRAAIATVLSEPILRERPKLHVVRG